MLKRHLGKASWDDREANGQQIWLAADIISIEAAGQQAQQVNLWRGQRGLCGGTAEDSRDTAAKCRCFVQ